MGLANLNTTFDAGRWQKSHRVRLGGCWKLEALVLSDKKRPKLFSLGRLGSPPPELPNHDWIVAAHPGGVNVTLVIRICGK